MYHAYGTLLHMNTDCIFCKISAGEIPSEKIYEDEHTFAFLDISPVNKGHTLVIPKGHYENIFEVPDEVAENMIRTVKKVSASMKENLGVDNLNLHMNNGKAAGQVVFHAHIHVIPRHADDGLTHWHGKELPKEEMKEAQEKLRKSL